MSGGMVGRVWAEFDGDASKLKRAANEASSALNNVKGAAGAAGGEISSAFQGMNLSIGGVLTALAAVTGAIKVAKEIFDFSAEGAQIASLEGASYKLAAAYGANMSSIVSSVKEASFNTITEYDAMRASNLALTMGISTSASEISNLLQIAMERGRAFGLTTEEAFDRMARGIGRRSTKILDDLGFTADAIAANKKYADSLGISTSALTDQMRVRALFLDILEQGNSELAMQGGLMMDISTPYQQVTTSIDSFYNSAKRAAAYGALPFIAKPETIKGVYEYDKAVSLLTGSYEDYMRAVFSEWAVVGGGAGIMKPSDMPHMEAQEFFYQSAIKRGEYARKINEELGVSYDVLSGEIKFASESSEEYNNEMQYQLMLTEDLTNAHEKYDVAMKAAGSNVKKQAAAQGALNKTYEDFILDMIDLSEMDMDYEVRINLLTMWGKDGVRDIIGNQATEEILGLQDDYLENLGLDAKRTAVAIDTAKEALKNYTDEEIRAMGPAEALWTATNKGLNAATGNMAELYVQSEQTLEDTARGLNGIGDTVVKPQVEVETNAEEAKGEIDSLNGHNTRSDHYVYVHFIGGGLIGTMGQAPGFSMAPSFGGGAYGHQPGFTPMHGGTFVGLQHGGIVPPGFANDGFPMFVSSGERVEVTPAGNKNIEGKGNTIKIMGPVTFIVNKDIRQEDLLSQLRL